MRTFHNLAMRYEIAGMKTIDQIRRENLQIAIKRMRTAAALAEAADTSAQYLSQIKKQTVDSKSGTPKGMGDDVARKIEKALGEPAGWMDVEHEGARDRAGQAPTSKSLQEDDPAPGSREGTNSAAAVEQIRAVIDGQHRVSGISDDSAVLLRAALQAIQGNMEPTLRAAVLLMLGARSETQRSEMPPVRRIKSDATEANSSFGDSADTAASIAKKNRAATRAAAELEDERDGRGKHGT
jgi:hypothetical protein